MIWGARLNETPNNVPFYTSTNELAHALDDSRPTAGAMAGMRLTTDYEQDVFAENDYSSVRDAAGDKQPSLEPPVDGVGRPYLVTEAVGTLSGPARFYRRTDPQAVQQGQATAHARVHDIAASDDRYCGLLAWSGFDYPSGSGGNVYRGVKYTGVVDLFRVAKPGAAIYRAQVDPRVRPVIAPAFYWDFGPSSPVTSLPAAMICANLDRLEVYVGGSHFSTAWPDTADYGSLAYPPSFVDFRGVDGTARRTGPPRGTPAGSRQPRRRRSRDHQTPATGGRRTGPTPATGTRPGPAPGTRRSAGPAVPSRRPRGSPRTTAGRPGSRSRRRRARRYRSASRPRTPRAGRRWRRSSRPAGSSPARRGRSPSRTRAR